MHLGLILPFNFLVTSKQDSDVQWFGIACYEGWWKLTNEFIELQRQSAEVTSSAAMMERASKDTLDATVSFTVQTAAMRKTATTTGVSSSI